MPATADELQKVFKTLSDPTRIRILRLLENEQLVVQELMEVLGMAQSRVSRHLAILREAGLVTDRRDRTFVSYRMAPPSQPWWRDAWKLVRENLKGDSTSERDDAALARVVSARGETSRGFFDIIGPEWDALRKVFNDDLARARAITRLVDPNQRVADIGTGTGILAIELARLGLDVIAVDGSTRMLEAARQNILDDNEVRGQVEFRLGDALALPLEDAEVDASFAHMVLQYLEQPKAALTEMCRITRVGGSLMLVDFVHHDLEWMRDELGVKSLGFEVDQIQTWFEEIGMVDIRIHVEAPATKGRDLPSTFTASGRRSGD
jgi:ubiquinone/menaquinone biosynthesis C-methylase UbiE/DNA-binding transcriptional ArsR family regulator